MSLGSWRAAGAPYNAFYERIASTLLQSGVLLVAAAGNESERPASVAAVGNPAACPSILAVAAVDSNDKVAAFSNGAIDGIGLLDVSAPGVGVYSAWAGGGYRTISGTSMACPHVAAVAALLAERRPELAANMLWKTIVNTPYVRPLPPLPAAGDRAAYGEGLIQAP